MADRKDTHGTWMSKKRLAKQSVAQKTCELLRKDIDDDAFFPHWEHEKIDKSRPKPGSINRQRSHPKKISSFFHQCAPQANTPAYLHVIEMRPSYERPPRDDSRKLAFYNLIQANEGFAILSSKKLPQICDFPIFLNIGPLNVTLKSNCVEIILTDMEIGKLRKFNTMIFNHLLKLRRSFMTVDLGNEENSYLIVPTKFDHTGRHIIDWNVIKTYAKIPVITKSSHCQGFLAGVEDYNLSVVLPRYWSTNPEMYIVTRVCHDMTPRSRFPSGYYSSFEDYCWRKHGKIVENKHQPLLEVKAISSRLNCLTPRDKLGQSTGNWKRQYHQEDFEGHFIPELCNRFSFPSALWLKATTLPSVLHRVAYLLIAEELRFNIAKDLGFVVRKDLRWEPLRVEESCMEVPEPSSSVAIPPLVEEIALEDALNYDKFINKPVGNVGCKLANTSPEHSRTGSRAVHLHATAPIRILEATLSSNGPQQYEILQALTAASSYDLIDMERLETLGDSFLNFSVSLFLFLNYSDVDEWKVTKLKKKIVCNRNLFYCGRYRGINNILKVDYFSPKYDRIPPGLRVPPKLESVLPEPKLCPNLVSEVQSSRVFGNHIVPDKCVADCVEALLGAYLKGYGVEGATKLLGWFGIIPPDIAEVCKLLGSPARTAFVASNANKLEDVEFHLPETEIMQLEAALDYHFKDRSLLLQALTHVTYIHNRITDCYERLEFLGDAILEFLITCFIYETCGPLSPGEMTDLRSSLVNNTTFACLAVRNKFHQYFKYESAKLYSKIFTFARFQESQNHVVNDEVLILEEQDCHMAESIEVPKDLGDLFGSLAGAVFIDSGQSLKEVWRVYYRLMKREINEFRKNIPKQPVRMLYEIFKSVTFLIADEIDNSNVVKVELEVLIRGEKKKYFGFGGTLATAKKAAAKLALTDLSCSGYASR